MQPEDFLYSSEFFSSASIIAPEEDDLYFAKASLNNLKGLLPDDISPETSPDILYLAANGAVAGMCNANGDAITVETALEVLKLTKNKYFNVDHKKDKVVGFVIRSGASKFGESVLLTDEEAAKEKVFNLAVAGGVWRAVNKDLATLLVESSDPSSINFHRVSLSWEIFFNNFDIAVGSKVIKDARLISDEAEKEKYKKYLKKFGGSGKCEEGFVYRVVKNTNGPENPNVIIGGYSFVINPAAEVKGIEVIDAGKLVVKEAGESGKASDGWVNFHPGLNSLNIPRAEMPQIKSAHRAALIQYLKGKSINYEKKEINPVFLKPSQAEYSPEKVQMAKDFLKENNRSILVSSDDYIIDGHHQWIAAVENNYSPIEIIKFDLPIMDALSLVKGFPSVELSQETASTAEQKTSQIENISVTPAIIPKINLSNIMDNIKSSADLAANWEAISKLEAQAGIDVVKKAIAEEVMKASEEWCEKIKAEKAKAEAAEAAVAEAQKCATEAKAAVEQMKAQMDEIKAAEMQRMAAEKYNERMSEMDAEYEFDDDERKVVAGKIKDMEDEAYASFQKEIAVMCKEKTKAFKKAKAEVEKTKAEAATASVQKTKEELAEEALASATAGKSLLTPGLEPTENLFAQMKTGFAAGVKVRGGKKE